MKKLYLFLILLSSLTFGKTTTFIPDENGKLVAQELAAQNNQIRFKEFEENKFQKPDFHKAFFKMILSLTAIIVLCFLTFWIFKRISKSRMTQVNNQRALKVIEKRILSPKSILYLIEYEGTKVLVSESHLDVKIKILNSSPKIKD